MRRAAWKPRELATLSTRLVLPQEATGADSPGTVVAALAYTLVPVLTFREAGGELTSALVSMLLSHGFGLALSPEYTEVLAQAGEVEEGRALRISGAGLVNFIVGREATYAESAVFEPRGIDTVQCPASGRHLAVHYRQDFIPRGKRGLRSFFSRRPAMVGTASRGFGSDLTLRARRPWALGGGLNERGFILNRLTAGVEPVDAAEATSAGILERLDSALHRNPRVLPAALR